MEDLIQHLVSNDTLRVITLGLFWLAWFLLIVNTIEERSTRHRRKHAYAFTIGIMRLVSYPVYLYMAYQTFVYWQRATSGWSLVHPDIKTLALVNYGVNFAFVSALGAVYLFCIVKSTGPDVEGISQRRIDRERRAEIERRRQA